MGYNLVLGKVNKLSMHLKKAAVMSKCRAGYPFKTILLNRVVDLVGTLNLAGSRSFKTVLPCLH